MPSCRAPPTSTGIVNVHLSTLRLSEHRLLLRLLFLGWGFGEGAAAPRHVGALAFEEVENGDDLDAGVLLLPEIALVEAGGGGFGGHVFCGRVEGEEDADGLLLAVEDAF